MRVSLPVILIPVVLVVAACATDRASTHYPQAQVATIEKPGPPECTDYDKALVASIEKRWFDLLDSLQVRDFRQGKVVVGFRLHADGSVTDLRMLQNATTELLGVVCVKSIMDGAPYPVWPAPIRQVIEKDYREVQFAFHFN